MTSPALSLLLGAVLAGFWPKFGTDPLEHPFPIEAAGNIRFQADAVLFRDGADPSIEVEIAIPIEDLSVTPNQGDSVLVAVELLDEEGDARASYSSRLLLPPDSTLSMRDPNARRWIRLHPRWLAGTEGLRVRVEDLSGSKRGVLDQARGLHPSGVAAARLNPPSGPDSLSAAPLSGILFARGLVGPQAEVGLRGVDATASGFRALRAKLEPNPYRSYGRRTPVLTFYWERYRPAGWGEDHDPRLVAHYEILRAGDRSVVRSFAESLQVAEARWDVKRFDIADLPTGTYLLRIALTDGAGEHLGESSGAFQVVWDRQLERLKDSELTTYARVLLSAARFEEFALLDRGAREAFLQQLWNDHDPTPPGEPNALEAKFYARVREAEHRYGGFPKALLSDRGGVWIRFGEPDEIRFNLHPQDEELLWQVLPEEIDESADDATARMRQTRHRSPLDNSAYEIWEYHGLGDPLFAEYAPPGQRFGLKFIFVDEFGVGDYTLVYTNLFGGMQ
ncbi:MAG: GWxTD domain-containing protein [Candidatus Eisenbacteria bacterium]|nr:GWxTD domain-containing protein [Candidatus Eisenbacteria bacterium]